MMSQFDSQWKGIMESSPFSEEVSVTLTDDTTTFTLSGMFCSGTYGERSETRYVRAKAIAKWSFMISTGSIPEGLTKKDLRNATLVRDGRKYRIVTITGADSGITTLELYENQD